MESITITNSTYQSKIDAFTRALEHLNKAMVIIREQNPNAKEIQKNLPFFKAYQDAESECAASICDISDAIGELVREDLTNVYL